MVVVIQDMGKPVSVVFTDNRYTVVKIIVDSIREHLKEYSVNEIESLVDDAIWGQERAPPVQSSPGRSDAEARKG